MRDLALRPAGPADAGRLNAALAALSADIGDTHRAQTDTLAAALSGAEPVCRAIVAETGRDAPFAGVALFSPVFSTATGGPGAYVSDLWVAAERRGSGLGRRLLAGVATEAGALWGARFIRLSAYADNAGALAFYERIGFRLSERDRSLVIDTARLEPLKGPA